MTNNPTVSNVTFRCWASPAAPFSFNVRLNPLDAPRGAVPPTLGTTGIIRGLLMSCTPLRRLDAPSPRVKWTGVREMQFCRMDALPASLNDSYGSQRDSNRGSTGVVHRINHWSTAAPSQWYIACIPEAITQPRLVFLLRTQTCGLGVGDAKFGSSKSNGASVRVKHRKFARPWTKPTDGGGEFNC